MINITKKFRKALFNDQRNYKELVTILLSDGTRLELTNENLLEGVGFDDMVSEDNNFQIGAAIINSASVKINNMYDDYTDYNFDYAKVYANVGLDFDDGTSEVIRKFTAYVDEAKYNGSAIELSCMDYMGLFDRVYDGNLGFPNTTLGIVQYCCTRCGITLGTPSFPRDDVQVAEHPDFGENCTYRQIISWVAQQSCCFARCNTFGELEIKWYDMDSLNAEANRLDGGQFDKGTPKYQTGDHADGGGFMTDGDEYDVEEFSAASLPVHVLNGIFSCEVCKDPVTITGISVTTTEYDETTGTGSSATTERKTYTAQVGTTDYLLAISGNPLISTPAMATEVANYIASKLVGFTFWIGHVSHLSDPSIEAGDVMLFSDYKGVTYRGVVSSTSFKCGESQTTDSSAETPNQNTKKQRSGADATTQAIMDIENWLHRQKTAYEIGIENLSNRLDAEAGIHVTKQTASGSGDIWYLHDKPDLDESTKIIKVTMDAIGFSTDGGTTWNSGMTIDGDLVVRVLRAKIVAAGWGIFETISDDAGKNSWDLVNGTLSMEKGSIQLGKISGTNNYNFTVNDQGQVGIKSGSIEIGTKSSDHSTRYFRVGTTGAFEWDQQYSRMSDTGELNILKGSITLGDKVNTNYYFATDTNGKFEWKSLKSSLDSNGVLSAQGANLEGKLTTEGGLYKTVIEDGFVKHYHNGNYFGKVGSSIFTQNKKGMMFDIGYDADYGGFAVQESANADASLAFWYDRTGDQFISAKNINMQSNTLTTASIVGNQQLNLEASQFNFNKKSGTSGIVIVEGNIYMNTSSKVATESYVDAQLNTHIADMTNNVLPQYATKSWVGQQGYLTAHQSLSGYAKESWVNSQGFLKTADLSQYATQNWVNSQGFLKNGSSSSTTYATQQYVSEYYQGVYDDWAEAATYKSISEFNRGSSNQFTGIDLRTLSWFQTVSDTDSRVITLSPKTYSGTCYLPCDTSFSTWITLKFYHGIAIVAS